jgi:hypothetical protein
MKRFYLNNWKHVMAFMGLLFLFSSGIYAATPQYLRVSGIQTHQRLTAFMSSSQAQPAMTQTGILET